MAFRCGPSVEWRQPQIATSEPPRRSPPVSLFAGWSVSASSRRSEQRASPSRRWAAMTPTNTITSNHERLQPMPSEDKRITTAEIEQLGVKHGDARLLGYGRQVVAAY